MCNALDSHSGLSSKAGWTPLLQCMPFWVFRACQGSAAGPVWYNLALISHKSQLTVQMYTCMVQICTVQIYRYGTCALVLIRKLVPWYCTRAQVIKIHKFLYDTRRSIIPGMVQPGSYCIRASSPYKCIPVWYKSVLYKCIPVWYLSPGTDTQTCALVLHQTRVMKKLCKF